MHAVYGQATRPLALSFSQHSTVSVSRSAVSVRAQSAFRVEESKRCKQAGSVWICLNAGGGVYYKGTVTQVRQQMPAGGVNLQGRQDYDPWEALEVEWDVGGDAEGMDHISPWEIEVCLRTSGLPHLSVECHTRVRISICRADEVTLAACLSPAM